MQRFLALGLLALPAWFVGPPPAQETEPVRGVVVDEQGRPLPGVRLWISGFEERAGKGWNVVHFTGQPRIQTSDARGRFEIPGRDHLRYDLDFDLDGRRPAFVQAAEPGADLRVVMEAGRALRGRVVQVGPDGERAIEGAPLAVTRPNGRGLWFQSERRSAADGSFAFAGFLPPEGAEGWVLRCAGASLPLEGVDVEGLRVEIRMTDGR